MSTRAPDFEVEREIGAGATARVFLAHLGAPLGELEAGAAVALKRLRSELLEDATARAAFEAEALAGASLRHPGLAAVLAAGEDHEGPWQLLTYAPGETLRDRLDSSGPLPEPLLRTVAEQLAGGLAALHAAGWAHGDIKPENMRLDERGRAVLLDLGFAVRFAPEDAAEPPERHAGSLPYLAPERVRGGGPTPASDVFSLGVVLYELATGVHPFLKAEAGLGRDGAGSSGELLARSLEASGADRILSALTTARFVPPSRLVPQLSPLFDALLGQMLLRPPLERPAAREVAERLAAGEAGSWWRALLDERPSAQRVALGAPRTAHLTPLVGRTRELEVLLEAWREVGATQRGSVVWAHGQEGSGKSRLVGEFAARARGGALPPMYLYGRCSAPDMERPAAPVVILLRRWLRLPVGSAPNAAERAHIERLLPPAPARALSLALEGALDHEASASLQAALADWLAALARKTPLLVFLDDVNFADGGTLGVLTLLAERLARAPLLLVVGERDHEHVARPEAFARVRERLLEVDGARELALAPLDEAAVLELVEELFHRSAPRRRIAQVLSARSRGNPGLLLEILRDLLERGRAHPRSSTEPQWVLDGPPEKLPLPRSLRTSIQRRFERLSLGDRRWLQRLAVVGGRIDADFLRRAFRGRGEGTLDSVLTGLVASGWLVPAGARYRFARPALREAAYRSIPEQRRLELHAQAARALRPTPVAEGGSGRVTLDDAFQRAFHLRAAEDHAALLRVLERLIPAMLRRGQPGRVHTLADWGLEALDAQPATRDSGRQRIRLLEAAADAADRLGRRETQRRWLDRLSDLDLSPEDDAAELARVYLLHGRFAANTGQYGLARGMLRNAVELAERAGGDELQSEVLRRLAAVQTHVGELGEAARLIEGAIAHAAHPPQEALAWLQKGLVQLLGDALEDTLRSVDRAMRLLRSASEWKLPGAVATGHLLRGRAYRLAGRPRRALASLQRAVRLAQESGERRLEMEARARLGGLMLDVDRAQEAETHLRDALLIADEIEDRRGRALASLWLGVVLWEQGDAEGAQLVARAARLAGEMGLARAQALALAIQARTALEQSRISEAETLSKRAAELVDAHGAELSDRIVILGTRALVLHAGHGSEEAEERLRTLRRRLRRENAKFENPVMRRRHRVASTRLLEAVLSPDGWLYPRVPLADLQR